MGVNGLFGLLQKDFPGVLNRIPDRFQGFGGKTVVFDATLITQRFHFAPGPHQYRHILGWYRLVSELRRHNVNAICVFDGKERSAAKAMETERRRQTRKLETARASKESERLARLCKLRKTMGSLPMVTTSSVNSPDSEQEEQPVNQNVTRQTNITPEDDGEALSSCKPATTATPLSDPPPIIPRQQVPPTKPPESPNEEPIPKKPDLRQKQRKERLTQRATQQTVPTLASTDDNAFSDEPRLKILTPVTTNISGQQDEISELYQQYLSAVSKPESGATFTKEDALESKSQVLLNYDENLLWNSVLSRVPSTSQKISNLLENLTERSQQLSDSYERRNPPSRLTYEQSRMMLEALGVPCIVCQGPFEAEALASSLVHHKIADYVASEDTDVIVYDAPLLRNITSRQGELVCVSGEGVREAMMLSRPAFVDFALLIGTDFTQRLYGVGPKRALQFISTHGCIEEVLQNQPRYAPPTAWMKRLYLRQIRYAREVFTSLPSVPDVALLEPRAVDQERVMELLTHFKLTRAAMDEDWDPQLALVGNYFGDNPRVQELSMEHHKDQT